MRQTLFLNVVLSALVLGSASVGVQAAPVAFAKVETEAAHPARQNVEWRRFCDRDGDRCRRVWVREYDGRESARERGRVQALQRQRQFEPRGRVDRNITPKEGNK